MKTCKYCRKSFTILRDNHCESSICIKEHDHWQTEIEWMRAISTVQFKRELDEMVKKGTKAWAGVPDAAEWVDNLRGNDE